MTRSSHWWRSGDTTESSKTKLKWTFWSPVVEKVTIPQWKIYSITSKNLVVKISLSLKDKQISSKVKVSLGSKSICLNLDVKHRGCKRTVMLADFHCSSSLLVVDQLGSCAMTIYPIIYHDMIYMQPGTPQHQIPHSELEENASHINNVYLWLLYRWIYFRTETGHLFSPLSNLHTVASYLLDRHDSCIHLLLLFLARKRSCIFSKMSNYCWAPITPLLHT